MSSAERAPVRVEIQRGGRTVELLLVPGEDCVGYARRHASDLGLDVSNANAVNKLGKIIEKKLNEAILAMHDAEDDQYGDGFEDGDGDGDGDLYLAGSESPPHAAAALSPFSASTGEGGRDREGYYDDDEEDDEDDGDDDHDEENDGKGTGFDDEGRMDVGDLLDKLTGAEEENKIWEEKCVELSEQLASKEDMVDALEKAEQALHDQCIILEEQLGIKDGEIDRLSASERSLVAQSRGLLEQLTEKDREIELLMGRSREREAALTDEAEHLRRQLATETAAAVAAAAAERESSSKLAESDNSAALTEEVERLRLQLAAAVTTSDKLQEDVERLQKEVAGKEREIEILSDQSRSDECARRALMEDVTELRRQSSEEIERLKSDLLAAGSISSSLSAELAETKRCVAQPTPTPTPAADGPSTEQHEQLQVKVDELLAQVASLKKDLEYTESQLEQERDTVDRQTELITDNALRLEETEQARRAADQRVTEMSKKHAERVKAMFTEAEQEHAEEIAALKSTMQQLIDLKEAERAEWEAAARESRGESEQPKLALENVIEAESQTENETPNSAAPVEVESTSGDGGGGGGESNEQVLAAALAAAADTAMALAVAEAAAAASVAANEEARAELDAAKQASAEELRAALDSVRTARAALESARDAHADELRAALDSARAAHDVELKQLRDVHAAQTQRQLEDKLGEADAVHAARIADLADEVSRLQAECEDLRRSLGQSERAADEAAASLRRSEARWQEERDEAQEVQRAALAAEQTRARARETDLLQRARATQDSADDLAAQMAELRARLQKSAAALDEAAVRGDQLESKFAAATRALRDAEDRHQAFRGESDEAFAQLQRAAMASQARLEIVEREMATLSAALGERHAAHADDAKSWAAQLQQATAAHAEDARGWAQQLQQVHAERGALLAQLEVAQAQVTKTDGINAGFVARLEALGTRMATTLAQAQQRERDQRGRSSASDGGAAASSSTRGRGSSGRRGGSMEVGEGGFSDEDPQLASLRDDVLSEPDAEAEPLDEYKDSPRRGRARPVGGAAESEGGPTPLRPTRGGSAQRASPAASSARSGPRSGLSQAGGVVLGTALERSYDEQLGNGSYALGHGGRPVHAGMLASAPLPLQHHQHHQLHQQHESTEEAVSHSQQRLSLSLSLSQMQADNAHLQLKLRDYSDVIHSLSSSQQALLGRMAELAREGRLQGQQQQQQQGGGREAGTPSFPEHTTFPSSAQGRGRASSASSARAAARPGRRLVDGGGGGRNFYDSTWASGGNAALGSPHSLYESLAADGGGAAFAFPATLPGSPGPALRGTDRFFAGPTFGGGGGGNSPIQRANSANSGSSTFLGLGRAGTSNNGNNSNNSGGGGGGRGDEEQFLAEHYGLLQSMLAFMSAEQGGVGAVGRAGQRPGAARTKGQSVVLGVPRMHE